MDSSRNIHLRCPTWLEQQTHLFNLLNGWANNAAYVDGLTREH
jgi:hypothetical protein